MRLLWSFPATVFLVQHGLLLKGQALWHVPVDYAIVASIVAVLSAITYVVVERPALKLRRPARRAPVPAKATMLAAEGAPLRSS